MAIFFTGGTGLIGGAVVDALIDAGRPVRGLARSPRSAAKLAERSVEPVRGDLFDRDVLEREARNSSGVIHAGSPMDERSAEADNGVVAAVLRGLSGSGKAFVYTNGLWVHGDTGDGPASETSPLNPVGFAAWRVPLEKRAFEAAADRVRTVVIRPAGVYGHGGGLPAMFVGTAADGGPVRYPGDGSNRWPVVHTEDLAELYVAAFDCAPAGSVYIAAEERPVPLAESARAAAYGAGAPGAEGMSFEEARHRWGPLADALVLDQVVTAARAHEQLGWQLKAAGIVEEIERGSYVGPQAGRAGHR